MGTAIVNDYREQVTTALEATVVHSPTAYSWYGKESARLSPRIKRAMTPRTARNYLRHQLQSQLYSDFYVRGGAAPLAWDTADVASDAIAFAGALSAANAGRGCCEDGWAVVAASAGEIVVRRNRFTLWVAEHLSWLLHGARKSCGR